jgi:hypothetical protein
VRFLLESIKVTSFVRELFRLKSKEKSCLAKIAFVNSY